MSVVDALYWFMSCMAGGFIVGITYSVFFHWGTWS